MIFTEEDLIKIRRTLHQIPEIGLEEFKTQAYLIEEIEKLCKEHDNVEIKTWETAILVKVKGREPKKTIGWRTDMDGLPIYEATDLPFKSRHIGQMHACGHDMHMSIALGLLNRVLEGDPQNNYVFLFQPAEENFSGGKLVYEAGNLEADFRPDEFYALHINPDLKTGVIASNNHTLFAGTCEVMVRFTGQAGHAAFPHKAHDMVVAVSQFVGQVQTIISRNIDPMKSAVITFGSLEAGVTNNVIAGEGKVHGTIRTLTREDSEFIQTRIKEISQGIAQSFNCQVEVDFITGGYLPVVNNSQLADKMITFFKNREDLIFEEIGSLMTGEDFGYLLDKIPGVMVWLGVDSYPLHHEKINPDERAIFKAVNVLSDWLLTC